MMWKFNGNCIFREFQGWQLSWESRKWTEYIILFSRKLKEKMLGKNKILKYCINAEIVLKRHNFSEYLNLTGTTVLSIWYGR